MSNNNSDASNKPIFKCGAFKFLNSDEVQCILCSKPDKPKVLTTKKNSFTTVLNHLKKHPEEHAKYEKLIKPQPITQYIPRGVGSLSSLDRRVIHYLAATYSPFNIVDHPTFHALFQSAKSTETLKGHRHYRDSVLPTVYKYAFERVRCQLKEIQWPSFTCDGWSGPNHAFFGHGIAISCSQSMGISVSQRTVSPRSGSAFRLVLNVREFPGKHSGLNVRAKVAELLNEWRVDEDRVHVVLHDEGSNMESAFNDDDDNVEDFACGAHKLNLVVRNGMWPNPKKGEKPTDVTHLLMRCRDVKQNELKERHLIQLTVRAALDSELRVYRGQHLNVEVAKMQRILADKFGGLSYYKVAAVADALDPRFKDTLITGEQGREFRENVVQWIGGHIGEDGPDFTTVPDVTRSPPAKRTSFMDSLRAKLVGNPSLAPGCSSTQPPAQSDWKAELEKFFREPTTPSWDDDPLAWWKENASRFPLIAPVARRYLGAPASSAASEQTFSIAKAVYDPRRSKMTPTKAEALIFLNRNLPLLGYRY